MSKTCPFMSGPVMVPVNQGYGHYEYFPEPHLINCIEEDCMAWEQGYVSNGVKFMGHCKLIEKG